MKLLWTKSSAPLSKLIRWGLNEPVSHFAIVFDDKIVFHANLLGLRIEWFESFKKKCTIVLEHEVKMSLEEEEAMYQAIITAHDGKKYDFKAFAYFCWRALLLKIAKRPLPKENAWNSHNSDICIEVIRYFASHIPADLPEEKSLAMISPYHLYLIVTGQLPKQPVQS